jgi:hypothetical protein
LYAASITLSLLTSVVLMVFFSITASTIILIINLSTYYFKINKKFNFCNIKNKGINKCLAI